jgi:hypothetical protein
MANFRAHLGRASESSSRLHRFDRDAARYSRTLGSRRARIRAISSRYADKRRSIVSAKCQSVTLGEMKQDCTVTS